MEHNNPKGRSGNVPLGPLSSLSNQHIYNGYSDQARLDGAAPASPSATLLLAQTPAASGNSAGVRPTSMFNSVASSYAPAAATATGADGSQQAHYAPNTAASDRSFHAIMIGDSAAQSPGRQAPLVPAAAAAISSHAPLQGMHFRPKPSLDSTQAGGLGDGHGGVVSSSLPSGNPFLHGMAAGGPAAVGPGYRVAAGAYPRIAYPQLNTAQGTEWAAALPSPGLSQQQQHMRTGSQQYALPPLHGHQQLSFAESSQATEQSALENATIRNVGGLAYQHWPQSAANSVYQTVTIGDGAHANTSADVSQHYPVSLPSLPPPGPASAGLSVYASGGHSPLVVRGRSRRRPHQAYDNHDPNVAGAYSSESSPAPSLTQPPAVRQSLSIGNIAESVGGTADSRIFGRRGSELNVSMQSMRSSENSSRDASHSYSPSVAIAASNGSTSLATRATPTYNYPEVAYRSDDATRARLASSNRAAGQGEYAGDQSEYANRGRPESIIMMGASVGSEASTIEGTTNSDFAMGYGSSPSLAGDNRHQPTHRQYGSSSVEGQSQEYANTVASMAQQRWNQGSTASPLRAELGASDAPTKDFPAPADLPSYTHDQQTAQQYATLPRSGYAAQGSARASGNNARGQAPFAAAPGLAANSLQLHPWPPESPQIRAANSSGSQQSLKLAPGAQGHGNGPAAQPGIRAHNSGELPNSNQTQGAPNILTDYYMVTSPNDQQYSEPHTPGISSMSLLPMVEVGQGGMRPAPTGDMDEINAHSQEYLHRRRRRLTQTLHNRQRSGSAVDVASRLSTTRLNAALPLSSPGANSHISARSIEDIPGMDGEQQATGRPRYQPPPAPPSTAAYGGDSVNYVPSEFYSVAAVQSQAQAHAQSQAHAHAQALAQIQTEYLQRLQQDYMQQERMQQERIQLERMHQEQMHAAALEQQRQKSKLAQEQELARFRNYCPLLSLTVDIAESYRKCHPEFSYDSARRPRRVLTQPSEGVKNDGFDNENSDYILYVNDVIGEKEGQQFLILEMLGSGTFGQVVKCQNTRTGELVAVKVIKNKSAYYNQSMMEVQMLSLLNNKYDVDDKHHILRLKESFVFRQHLVFVNELLSINLYDLLKQNMYHGLSTNLVRVLVQQILDAMIVLKQAEIIHADLKPENILLEDMGKPVVKVIDFGSACFEWQTTFTYIQSRFYRSPEILLGLPYSSRIDMWSLGCIVAELYLGLPLFPGSSEYNQLSRIVDLLGLPPSNMLERARRTDEFFNYLGPSTWDLKSMIQYARERNVEEKQSKRYFTATTLEELITTYPIRRRLSEADQQREYQTRYALIDFLRGLLHLDPDKRWSPQQAAVHPFITGEPLVGAFIPPSFSATGGSHGPGGGTGPYGGGPAGGNGTGYGRSAGGVIGGGNAYSMQGASGDYGQMRSLGGYSSHQGTDAGSNGHAAYAAWDGSMDPSGENGTRGSTSTSEPLVYGTGGSSNPSADDSMAWNYYQNIQRQGMAQNPIHSDDKTSIPGSYPFCDSSGGIALDAKVVRAGVQVTRGMDTERLLAATNNQLSANSTFSQNTPADTFMHQYQRNSFLGVDPSSSYHSDCLTADSDSRDEPGHPEISQSNSEYSVDSSYGCWSWRSETDNKHHCSSTEAPSGRLNHQRQLPPKVGFGESLAASDSCDSGSKPLISRISGQGHGVSRVVGVVGRNSTSDGRSQQRYSLSTSLDAEGDGLFLDERDAPSTWKPQVSCGLDCARPSTTLLRSSAGACLVSSFSPLTVPSTLGSLQCVHEHSNCASASHGSSRNSIASYQAVDQHEFSGAGGSDDESRDDGEDANQLSDGSGLSRPLTQAHMSEESLSMYSAASGQDFGSDVDAGERQSMHSNDGWSDGLSSWSSGDSDNGDFFEATMAAPQARAERGCQVFPQELQHSLSSNHDAASLLPGTGTGSIYHLPQHAFYSQDLLYHGDPVSFANGRVTPGSDCVEFVESDKVLTPSSELGAYRSWAFDAYDESDSLETASVISQDKPDGCNHRARPHEDLEETSSLLEVLDISRTSPTNTPGSDGKPAARPSDGHGERIASTNAEESIDSGISDSGDSCDLDGLGSDSDGIDDNDDDGVADQDVVLFAGKLHLTPKSQLARGAVVAGGHRRRLSTLTSPSANAAAPLDSLRAPSLPTFWSARCASLASYPQKIAKKSHLRRSDRPLPPTPPSTLLLKDSMRMVESLRRMGKWRDAGMAQTNTYTSRANQFYLDPVIVAMSPRLMPPSGQPG
ncbi:dual specificity protein kinase yak1 [Coemansia thaxteri]|uniref:Dual specificity protein kinase yak1 n=1 Tax=Coemansia thaxteri TaxID=2663907 RepID=A0A9W8EK35_9FUNG|nr:dual specificity protein kinase yak1 [Coemansia thaxteri]